MASAPAAVVAAISATARAAPNGCLKYGASDGDKDGAITDAGNAASAGVNTDVITVVINDASYVVSSDA